MPSGRWRARARYRFGDGKARQIERSGTSRTKAEAELRKALLTIEHSRGGALTPTTTLRELGQRFLAHKRDLERSEGTIETYGYAVTAHITPRLGTSPSRKPSLIGCRSSSTPCTRSPVPVLRRTAGPRSAG